MLEAEHFILIIINTLKHTKKRFIFKILFTFPYISHHQLENPTVNRAKQLLNIFSTFLSWGWPYISKFIYEQKNVIGLHLQLWWNKEQAWFIFKAQGGNWVFGTNHCRSKSASIYWAGYCRNMRCWVNRHCRVDWIIILLY